MMMILRGRPHKALSRAIQQQHRGWTRISPPQPTYVGTISSGPSCLDAFLIMARCPVVEASALVVSIIAEMRVQQPMIGDHLLVILHRAVKKFCPFLAVSAALKEAEQWVARVSQLYHQECEGHNPHQCYYKFHVKVCHLVAQEACAFPMLIPSHFIELNLYYLRVAQNLLMSGRFDHLQSMCSRARHWHLDLNSAEFDVKLVEANNDWRERALCDREARLSFLAEHSPSVLKRLQRMQ